MWWFQQHDGVAHCYYCMSRCSQLLLKLYLKIVAERPVVHINVIRCCGSLGQGNVNQSRRDDLHRLSPKLVLPSLICEQAHAHTHTQKQSIRIVYFHTLQRGGLGSYCLTEVCVTQSQRCQGHGGMVIYHHSNLRCKHNLVRIRL